MLQCVPQKSFVYAALLLFVYPVLPESIRNQRGDWKVDRVLCSNATACHSHYCNIKLKSARVQHLNVGCMFNDEQHHIGVHLKLYYKSSARFMPFLIDLNIDYCNFATSNWLERNPMAQAMVPLFEKYTNINHTCPLHGMIFMKDAPLSRSLVMGAQMPIGKYRVDFYIYNTKTMASMLLIQLWFTVVP